MSRAGRNDPCPCGSGRKFKACCGRLEPALVSQQRIAELLPHSAAAHNNLGNDLADAGRLEEASASYRRALQLHPDFPEAHYNLGNVQLDGGQYQAASASYQRAVDLRPDYAEAWNQWGSAARALGQLPEALVRHQRALALQPEFAEAHHALGVVLRDLDRLDEAVESYRRAALLAPDGAGLHRDLAVALRLQGRSDDAEASLRRALAIDPNSSASFVVLAETHADRGRFGEAEELLRRALALEPTSADALAGITRLRRMTPADGEWLAQAQRLAERGLPPRREVPLRYAIGKYFDDVGDYAPAFAQFRRANELTRSFHAPFNRQQLTRAVDACLVEFGSRAAAPAQPGGAHSPARQQPVFVVGMPRSGTSLAEQILASHSEVFGAGELSYWNRAAVGARGRTADAECLQALARDYREWLLERAPGARRVLDKMPSNFQHLGLIHRALPDARVIHLQRHPIDTCLSIYFQHFEATHAYANDLEDLAHAYREYQRLMRHWRQWLPPDRLLEVPYEGLIDDQETWSQRMVAFLGLDWEPQCLHFERTERTVITASKWQVRQPINRHSIERWRHYEAFVMPLRSLLEPVPA